MLIKKFERLTPQRQLQLLSRAFVVVSVLIFLMMFSSLVVTASNFMIVNEMSTDAEWQQLSDQYSSYLTWQRVMIGMNVVIFLCMPLMMFSVYSFQMKGNKIIMIFVGVLIAVRWVAGVAFLASSSPVSDAWNNLWSASDSGNSPLCLNQSCGGKVVLMKMRH